MSSNVVKLQRLSRRDWDWSPRELAEFYRVESALIQAGLKIDTERGLSDEEDPWFAFCRQDDGEVIVHIARIDGVYILAGPTYRGISSGSDIGSLVRDLISRHPLVQMPGDNRRQGSNIFLHPAALLIAVVATAFFKATDARALTAHTSDDSKHGDGRGGAIVSKSAGVSVADADNSVVMDAAQGAVILSAIASVLQAPPPAVAEHDTTPSTASTLDLADAAILAVPAFHPEQIGSLSVNAQDLEARGLQGQDDSGLPSHLPAVETAIALPLVLVLWDLPQNPSDTKTGGHDASLADNAAAVTIAPRAESVATQSPLLTFKMALADSANDSLPAVQSVTISHSGTQGVVETHTVAQPDQLPTALINALQGATQITIEGQPAGLPSNASFASSLILALTNPAATDLAAATPAVGTHSSISTDPTTISTDPTTISTDPTTISTNPTTTLVSSSTMGPTPPVSSPAEHTDQSSPSTPPPQYVDLGNLEGVLQNFLSHTPKWEMVSVDKEVILYDAGALTSDISDLKSVTFDFSDGSTLSLVGLPAALPHSHVA
jgi:hypothetical protein